MTKETVTGEYYLKVDETVIGDAKSGKTYYVPAGEDYERAVRGQNNFKRMFDVDTTIVTADIDLEDGKYRGEVYGNAFGVSFYESGEYFRETGVGRKMDA
jgi:hypothetical protein